MKNTIEKINKLNLKNMYLNDFLLTWEKTDDEIAGVFQVAEMLRKMRENNISTRIFDSGLGVSLFRDNSTRTRFSFAIRLQSAGPDGAGPRRRKIADSRMVRRSAKRPT